MRTRIGLTMLLAVTAAGPATQPAAVPTLDLFKDLRTMAAKRAADPIGPIADRMSTIAGQLEDMQTDNGVQDRQRGVTAQLDAVIAALEKQAKSGAGGGNPNPSKPMQRSMITKGPGGQGELHDAAAGTRSWAKLRPQDRATITQTQTEGFPPGYEQVLSSYYGRLAQEQVNAEPTTRPAEK